MPSSRLAMALSGMASGKTIVVVIFLGEEVHSGEDEYDGLDGIKELYWSDLVVLLIPRVDLGNEVSTFELYTHLFLNSTAILPLENTSSGRCHDVQARKT